MYFIRKITGNPAWENIPVIEDAVHPGQAQVLYTMTRKNTYHTGDDEMRNGRPAKGYEKDVFRHFIGLYTCKDRAFQSNCNAFPLFSS